jgi:hypothetical protein
MSKMIEMIKQNDNLELYNKLREVPETAKRAIEAGRLKGKTDINPMWRIKKLTETFGTCGFGWKTKTIKKWIEEGGNSEKSAFVDIELYIKINDEWSEAIEGNGGSSFIAKERNGMYTNDECFKMAFTDALSVACKMIGIGADVYWEADKTKYTKIEQPEPTEQKKPDTSYKINEAQLKLLCTLQTKANVNDEDMKKYLLDTFKINSRKQLNSVQFETVINLLQKKINKQKKEAV